MGFILLLQCTSETHRTTYFASNIRVDLTLLVSLDHVSTGTTCEACFKGSRPCSERRTLGLVSLKTSGDTLTESEEGAEQMERILYGHV